MLFVSFVNVLFVFLFISFYFSCGPSISFSFGFTYGGTNLVYATNESEIFVDCSRSDELFNGYSFINEFSKFPPLECNLFFFYHFFNPYISLNLEEFYIPTSPYSSLHPIVHPSTIVVLFSTSSFVLCLTSFVSASWGRDYLSLIVVVMSFKIYSIMCLIFVSVPCAYDSMLSLVANLCVFSSNFQLTYVSITCDLMVFGSKFGEGTDLKCPIQDVLKSHFLDLNEKEVENVDKSG